MEKLNQKRSQIILPANGVWTIQALADWLGMNPDTTQQALTDNGIKVIHLGKRFKYRIFRMEDLRSQT